MDRGTLLCALVLCTFIGGASLGGFLENNSLVADSSSAHSNNLGLPESLPPRTHACTNCIIQNVTVGNSPLGLTYDSQNNKIFVPNFNDGNLSVIDGATDKVITSISVGSAPQGACFDTQNGEIFVPNSASDTVTIINGSTNIVVTSTTVTTYPRIAVFDNKNNNIYVTEGQSSDVSIINTSSNTVSGTIPTGAGPYGIAFDPQNGNLFVGDSNSNQVTVIDGSNNSVLATVPVGSQPWGALVYDPIDGDVIVPNALSNNITVINATTDSVVASVPVGTYPYGVTLDSANGEIYVGNQNSNNVSVINGGTLKVDATISMPANPNFGAFDSTNNQLFIPDGGTTLVSVIDAPPASLFVSSFVASKPNLDVNQTTILNVTSVGGKPAYSYNYSGLPTGCNSVNSSTLSCTPTLPGTSTVKVTVHDSLGNSTSAQLMLTIYSAPKIVNFTSIPNPVYVNNSTALKATLSGGSPTITYSYVGLPSGCASTNSALLNCTPIISGDFSIKIFAIDGSGISTNASLTLKVLQPQLPTILAFKASPNPLTLGQTTILNVTVTGGSIPYGFSFAGLPLGCTSSNTSNLQCTPTVAGTFTVTVTVTDTFGNSTSRSVVLQVNNTTPTVLSIQSISANPNPVYANSATDISTQVQGGVAPYIFAYSGLPSGCSSASSASFTCVPSAPGNFTVTATVKDSATPQATATGILVVKVLSTKLTISLFTTSSPSVTIGNSTTFVTKVENGSTPYTYSYSSLPPGCYSANVASLPCIPDSLGSFKVWVLVTDANGNTASAFTNLTVTGVALPLSVVLSSNATSIVTGSSVTLYAQVSGGTSPISLTWSLNGSNSSHTGQTWIIVLPHAGTYTFGVWATDATNRTAPPSFRVVDVTNPNGGTPTHPSGKSSFWNIDVLGIQLFYILLLIIVLIAVAILALVLFRSRSSESTLPEPPPQNVASSPVASPKIPSKYYEGLLLPPAPPEWSEDESYGTYLPPPPRTANSAGVQEVPIPPHWSLTVSPSGLHVENTLPGVLSPSGDLGTLRKEGGATPLGDQNQRVIPTEIDAYNVLAILSKAPCPLPEIRLPSTLTDTALYGLLTVLVDAGLVLRQESPTKGQVYALTRIGWRFVQSAKSDGLSHVSPVKKSDIGTIEIARESENVADRKSPISPPNTEDAPVPRVILERRIGPNKNEENPFGGSIKPEEVNPNVQHIDPQLLQPMELRVDADRGKDSRDSSQPSDVESKTQNLMSRAKKSRAGLEKTTPNQPKVAKDNTSK